MSTPKLEDYGILREWAPLSRLLKEIPLRKRSGLFIEDIKLTSVDAVMECIVVGTSSGVTYWYDRSGHHLCRLVPKKEGYPITCVRVVSTVDFMVAAGDKSGALSIFRIPKPSPSIPESEKKIFYNQVERFTVGSLHSGAITALEWSTNGQKLFSGDSNGCVILTEIDYTMNLSKTREIVNERFPVVQLSYVQRRKLLLVATEFRCILCHYEPEGWVFIQIGQKERERLLKLGGYLYDNLEGELVVYSCRGGLRLWKSETNGLVKQTLLFKPVFNECNNPVRLLKSEFPDKQQFLKPSIEFGRFLFWRDGLFVSYNSDVLMVLDPGRLKVVATMTQLHGIVSASVTPEEIFVLAGERDLIRLSFTPDIYDSSISGVGNMATAETVSTLPSIAISPILGVIPKISSFIQSSLDSSASVNGSLFCGASEVIYGMDMTQMPSIEPVALHDGVPEVIVHATPRYQVLKYHGNDDEDDDEIIYNRGKLQKSQKKPTNQQVDFENGNEDIVETLHSPEKLPNGNDEKSCTNIHSEPESQVDSQNVALMTDSGDKLKDLEALLFLGERNGEMLSSIPEAEIGIKEYCETKKERNDIEKPEETLNTSMIEVDLSENVSQLVSTEHEEDSENDLLVPEAPSAPLLAKCESINENWLKLTCPKGIINFSVADDYLVVCTSRLDMYLVSQPITLTQFWCKLPSKAEFITLSLHSWTLACKILHGTAQFTRNWCEGNDWTSIAKDVTWASLSEDKLWYVSDGDLYNVPFDGEVTTQCVPFNEKVLKISASDTIAYVITTNGELMGFDSGDWLSVTSSGRSGNCDVGDWYSVSGFEDRPIKHFAVGPRNLIWLVDQQNNVYVSENIKIDTQIWWQVVVKEFNMMDVCGICATDSAVFICNNLTSEIYMNSTSVKGHRWISCDLSAKCSQITAEGMFEDHGCLWLLIDQNKLMGYVRTCETNEEIQTPGNIVCLASTIQVLWVLTDDGCIHVRQDIYDNCSFGTQWRKLNLDQMTEQMVQLSHISCSTDVVWGCDIRGNIYMLVGSPHAITIGSFIPVWVPIEGSPLHNNTFTKVYVGSESYMVWALDNAGNVYVREGIFPDFLFGTGWVHVSGIKASQLSISSSAVWALTKNGVYIRTGISQSNFIGEAWILIAGELDFISVTVNEHLYGVCSKTGQLMYLREKVFCMKPNDPIMSWSTLPEDDYT